MEELHPPGHGVVAGVFRCAINWAIPRAERV